MNPNEPIEKRPKMSEANLIRRAQLEDASAYEELVRRYDRSIYGLIYGVISRRDAAERLTQEVFVRAWKAIGHFREQGSFHVWVHRIALHRIKSFSRTHVGRHSACYDDFDPEVKQTELYRALSSKGGVLRKMSLSAFQKKLADALVDVPIRARMVLILHDVQEVTLADAAELLGGSEEAARSELEKAHAMLQEALQVSQESIADLVSLKRFERPDPAQVEKKVHATMQAVRAAHKRPSLLLFPDKSLGWMLAQPRYGMVLLLLIFLGLHTCGRTVPLTSTDAPEFELAISPTQAVEIPSNSLDAFSPDYPGIHPDPYTPKTFDVKELSDD